MACVSRSVGKPKLTGDSKSTLPVVGDFHCGECGLTLHKRTPNFKHVCTPSKAPTYQNSRTKTCETCRHNLDGVCQSFKRIHPDRECLINIGVKIARAECPEKRWLKMERDCQKCGATLFSPDENPRCIYCELKATSERKGKLFALQQKSLDDYCIAATSLAPGDRDFDKQTAALNTWGKFGLSITAVQRTGEIEELKSRYPQVTRWVANDETGSEYDNPTQPINKIADVATETGQVVLVINADIEVYGNQEMLTEALKTKKQIVGIRWNHDGNYQAAKRERWGLDVFSFSPEMAASLPRMPLSIGRPFWDYWIPIHCLATQTPMHFIGERLFYHRRHEVNWSRSDWSRGETWVTKHYGVSYGHMGSELRKKLPFPPKIKVKQK